MNQLHINYRGFVQGVGFRYTTQRIASNLSLTGWVRNLSDGSVEILAEGDEKSLEQMCCKIEEYFGGYIKDKNIIKKPAEGKYQSFNILH